MKLKSRLALVTGAGRGIGRAIALALAREGADLVLVARSREELDEVAAAAAAHAVTVTVVVADLGHRSALDEVSAAIKDRPVGILVNNAGIGTGGNARPVVSFDDAFWDYTLHLNLTVPYLLCRRVLPAMLAARRGRIINIASIAGRRPTLHGAAYVASKHGLLGLTRAIALEVVKDGITANAICPGVVASKMNDKRMAYEAGRLGKSVAEVEAASTPLGRRLTAEEVAPLAVFLASDEAGAITGQAYNVDAGAVMS